MRGLRRRAGDGQRRAAVVLAALLALAWPGPAVAAPGPATPAPAVAPSARAQAGPPAAAPPARAPTPPPAASAAGSVHGFVFYDADGDGGAGPEEEGVADVEVVLTGPSGAVRRTRSNEFGAFQFDRLAPGRYRLGVRPPGDERVTGTPDQPEVTVPGAPPDGVPFGLAPAESPVAQDAAPGEVAEVAADGAAPAGAEEEEDAAAATMPQAGSADAEPEQVMALAGSSLLPLRFAAGRDTLAQAARRQLAAGVVWLGVPFVSQIDGSEYQFSNCGPASLAMVLASFGLEVGPMEIRDYLNTLVENFDPDEGTSLDVLGGIARAAGLVPVDLYAEDGYRGWSTDAIRWHVEQGHPVITLVKYRRLPGHMQSPSDTDHYIVISGLTPDGFIYNDAAYASTLGYGLVITGPELEAGWELSSIPRHGLALALADDPAGLSFPERPRPTPSPTPVREPPRVMTRLGIRPDMDDERVRAPLTITPAPAPAVPTAAPGPSGVGTAPPDDAAPMGLLLEPVSEPETRPGPWRLAPQLSVALGALWAAAVLGSLVRSSAAGVAGRRLLGLASLAGLCLRPAWRVSVGLRQLVGLRPTAAWRQLVGLLPRVGLR